MMTYTIYRCPLDYPDSYVVRRWLVGEGDLTPDDEPLAVVGNYHEALMALPWGLHRMPREENDDPVILETWI